MACDKIMYKQNSCCYLIFFIKIKTKQRKMNTNYEQYLIIEKFYLKMQAEISTNTI